ncbi:hypothetical protein H0H81_010309, partial [Sphagnurus paluster]
YVCPKCNHFNRSPNAKKHSGLSTPSPTSTSPLPTSQALPRNSPTPEKRSPPSRSASPPTVDAAAAESMEVDDP